MTSSAVTLTIQPTRPCVADPDLWFTTDAGLQSLAVHICRSHCPKAQQAICAEDAARHPSPDSVQNGVAYDPHGKPYQRQPQSMTRHCVACGGVPLLAGDHRKPPEARDECGTVTGWRMHGNRNERKCDECQEAYRLYQIDKRDRRKREAVAA